MIIYLHDPVMEKSERAEKNANNVRITYITGQIQDNKRPMVFILDGSSKHAAHL